MFGSWFGVHSVIAGEYAILAEFVGLIAVGAIAGGGVAGYVGINSKKPGAGAGVVVAGATLRVYLLYSIITGAINLVFNSISGIMFDLVIAIVAITILACAGCIFLVGQYARKYERVE